MKHKGSSENLLLFRTRVETRAEYFVIENIRTLDSVVIAAAKYEKKTRAPLFQSNNRQCKSQVCHTTETFLNDLFLSNAFKRVIHLYLIRGFRIRSELSRENY